MPKESVFTMKLESDLRADFMAEAEALHRPASQVVRELMRAFVEGQRQKREHSAFLERKVMAARASARAGIGRDNAEVETDFAARRARIADQG